MTRVTNFGRKRTYLEAGFENNSEQKLVDQGDQQGARGVEEVSAKEFSDFAPADGEPPKKKRKRVRKKKPKTSTTETVADGEGKDIAGEDGDTKTKDRGPSKKALKKKKWKEMEKAKKQRRLLSSEMRRQKRIDERFAATTCFACRENGHAAKDCPNVKNDPESGGTDKSKGGVGLCYRCGSTRHMLSKCKKNVDELNPYPFASCFVCNGKGHLASACPENKDNGIYPNGGCCKLCGEKTHLAKDCDLRKKDNVDTLAIMGTGERPGADEDDFHTFKRRKQEVEKDVKTEVVKKKMLQVKAGVHSGVVVKSFASVPKATKKIVFF